MKTTKTKPDLNRIADIIAETVGGLSTPERAGVILALNSRTGQLKAKSPSAFGTPIEKLACAAWQAIQPNGYKISIGTLLYLRDDAKDLYDRLSKVRWPDCFDKDKTALKALGVW